MVMRVLLVCAVLLPLCRNAWAGDVATLEELPRETREIFSRDFPTYFSSTSLPAAMQKPPAGHPALEVLAALPKELQGRVVYHPVLDWTAAACAQSQAALENIPSEELLQWMLHKTGVAADGPWCNTTWWTANVQNRSYSIAQLEAALATGSAEEFASRIQSVLGRLNDPQGRWVFGIYRIRGGGMRNIQALVLARELVTIQPLAKRHAADSTVTLVGRFIPKPVKASVFVDEPDGTARRSSLDLGPDGSFTIKLRAPELPGEYTVQVTRTFLDAKGGALRNTALKLPIQVDTEEPAKPDAFMAAALRQPAAASQWSTLILAAINTLRARYDLPRVELHKDAVIVAQAFAQQLAGSAAPVAPVDDEVLHAALASRKVVFRGVDQRLSGDRNADLWLRSALGTPASRADLLDPTVTRLGLGISSRGDRYVFMLLTLRDKVHVDVPVERELWRASFQAARAKKMLPELLPNTTVEATIQTVTLEVCTGALPLASVENAITEALKQQGLQALEVRAFSADYVPPARWMKTHPKWVGLKSGVTGVGVCQLAVPPAKHPTEVVTLVRVRDPALLDSGASDGGPRPPEGGALDASTKDAAPAF